MPKKYAKKYPEEDSPASSSCRGTWTSRWSPSPPWRRRGTARRGTSVGLDSVGSASSGPTLETYPAPHRSSLLTLGRFCPGNYFSGTVVNGIFKHLFSNINSYQPVQISDTDINKEDLFTFFPILKNVLQDNFTSLAMEKLVRLTSLAELGYKFKEEN
jgi:hypothetical protein